MPYSTCNGNYVGHWGQDDGIMSVPIRALSFIKQHVIIDIDWLRGHNVPTHRPSPSHQKNVSLPSSLPLSLPVYSPSPPLSYSGAWEYSFGEAFHAPGFGKDARRIWPIPSPHTVITIIGHRLSYRWHMIDWLIGPFRNWNVSLCTVNKLDPLIAIPNKKICLFMSF